MSTMFMFKYVQTLSKLRLVQHTTESSKAPRKIWKTGIRMHKEFGNISIDYN